MKKSILIIAAVISCLLLTSQVLTSCGNKSQQATEEGQALVDSTDNEMKADSTAMAYACPMHPDVTGKAGDTCSKCGMDLVAVKTADSTKHEH